MTIRTLSRSLISSAAILFMLAGSVACRGANETARASAPAPQYLPLSTFPPLGPAADVDRGVVVHQVSLVHGENAGRIWIYLPKKLPATPIPCVFIAPAGVPPFVGNGFGPDLDRQKNPEHLPYVRAGFAVVAYDVDGELESRDATYGQVLAAATAFKNAEAGALNARHAIDYVLKMVPAIDPKRLYSAGHSSAGRIALLVAESDPRIAACAAYAPVTDVERRVQEIAPDAGRFLESNLPGFRDFLRRTSPIRQTAQLRCPVFLFHSQADRRIPINESQTFVDALGKTNARVTFVRGATGDHYGSMIEQGVPQGIRWLRGLPVQ
jgi:dipeptidyl aminopeptidase/acylaminoacyl peptidase